MRFRTGPRALWLIRHAQSEGNVARTEADEQGLEFIELATRDADVPLSELGERQARAFGAWLGGQPPSRQPTAVVSSPYLRTRETGRLVLAQAALDRLRVDVDERLRDREIGGWDRLTWKGICARYPEEAERARRVGRFFHRPPGGESWADICLRLRSVLDEIARELPEERVLIVAHDVVIQLARYIIEGLTEAEVVANVRDTEYANTALTAFERGADGYDLIAFNHVVPVEEHGAPATEEGDVAAGPR